MDEESLGVWLVNDDATQLKVQKRLLAGLAYAVTDFLSPLEAVAAARKGRSSPYLITDLHMPEMSGIELAKFWLQLHPKARIILLSASAAPRAEQQEIDKLPPDSVRLLAGYRIPLLRELATSWFFNKKDAKPRPAAGEQKEALKAEGLAYIDLPTLQKLSLLGGSAFAQEIANRFLESGKKKVEEICSAFKRGDVQTVYRVSHALKGSCGLIGAFHLYQVADAIESLSSSLEPSAKLGEYIEQLARVGLATIEELRQLKL